MNNETNKMTSKSPNMNQQLNQSQPNNSLHVHSQSYPNSYPHSYLNPTHSYPNQMYNQSMMYAHAGYNYWNPQLWNQQQMYYQQQYSQNFPSQMPFNSANMASNQGYSNNTYRKFSPTNANFNRNGNNFNKNRNQQRSPQFDKVHHQQNQKKQKVDKRDLPENNQFYCEVCDRGFKTDEKYAEHCATHKTCSVNGCKFTAAAKLVEIHYRNVHSTGLYKKISNLETKEDIQKYINERKKNFPSKDNFEKKSNLNEIKEKCGAVLSTAQYALGKRIKQRNNWPKRTEQRVEQADRCNEEKEEGEEDESREQSPKSSSPKTIVSNRSIGKKKKKRNKKSLFQLKSEVLRSRFQRPTLLQKLLGNEIRHERNMILQCVRFVVENNFFDKPNRPIESQEHQKHEQPCFQHSDLT